MGKAEVGTPKWLANKMKSKGLQKLRWYCQMCQKQCRDQNGFKCHTQSESHQRQLLIFAENPHRFLDTFSQEFEDGYLNLLKRQYGTKRVHANMVYQDYIRDKDHIHMNGTIWTSLTGFCKHLGRTGKAVVDETEKGWYVTWIDRDPETIARQEALAKRDKLARDDEERLRDYIAQQVEKAKLEGKAGPEEKEYTELKRENEEEKITLNLGLSSVPKPTEQAMVANKSVFKVPVAKAKNPVEKKEEKKKKSALDEIMEEDQRRKRMAKEKEEAEAKAKKPKIDMTNVKDYWLKKDIVVKIVTKSLGDKYYKQKGYVKEVIDKYAGVIVLLDTNAKIKLDQAHLETVIPKEGRAVLVLNGEHRGNEATLKTIDVDNFCAVVKLETGPAKGQFARLPYEHFSKLYDA